MNLEQLKGKTLEGETFDQLKAFVDEIAAKRDAAVAEIATTRKGLREENARLKAIRDTLFEKLGIDEDADLDTMPEVKGQAEAAKQFEQRIKRLEREKAEAIQKGEEIEGKYKGSRLDAALAKAISAHEFIDSELVASHIGSRVQWEDDQIMVKDGDKLMTLEDGVKMLAQTKPHLLKAAGARGSGHPPGAGGAGHGMKTMTRAEFDALPPAARVEAAKSGVQLT